VNASDQTAPLQLEAQAPRWNLATRIGFRFCFVYFGLYCLTTQILGSLVTNPEVDVPDPSTLWPMRQIIFWTAAHIFRVAHPLVYGGSGSGDKTFDWVAAFCLLIFAILATVIWSGLDRRRENYASLYKWFRVCLRFALASQMFSYGLAKLVPLQMPFPYLTTLLEPYGNFSPMGVLWSSVGASPAYEIFAGSAEMLAGILLIFPRTTTLGALVCLIDSAYIFTLNMTYDVPVKLFAFHMILMSVFLLAPEFSRLVDFFLRNRLVEPSTQPALFRTRRANRIALAVQIVIGVWLVGINAYGSWSGWHIYGDGRPKSALYGIWNVDEFTIDGQTRSPLLTDNDRWRRIVFDFPERTAFERMDETFARYSATIDINNQTLGLTKNDDKNWKADFHFQRAAQDQLTLDGKMDGHTIHMQLQLVDRNKFLLVNRGFHWIQEYPYNR
jgi:uncharacterized membrane protein YphA (DoxX/SURF4 family)